MKRTTRIASAVAVVALALVPTAAQADPTVYEGPIFGIDTGPNDTLLVANTGKGIVNGVTNAILAPASEFAATGLSDVAPIAGTNDMWAISGGGPGIEDQQFLYRVSGGQATEVADLWAFEEKYNPHPEAADSNPFDVEDLGGGEALVADAGGNTLLKVDKHGKVKLVAVLPDELVSTQNIKTLAGCQNGPPPDFCGLPAMMPAQPVATSVAIGPDGAFYVGELKGFPAPAGESRVWRIAPNARNAQCGRSPLCTVVFDDFTSVIDLVFGPEGELYVTQFDDASWAAIEIFQGDGALGGSVHACNLASATCGAVVSRVPMLTAITFRASGLWGAHDALTPDADVTELT